MTHRTFAEIGDAIARNGWGRDDGGNFGGTIQVLKADERSVCLLAAAVIEIGRLSEEIRTMRHACFSRPARNGEAREFGSNVADATLAWLAKSSGDVPVDDMDTDSLSVRARGVLLRSGIRVRSQITPEALAGVRNCGEVTMQELVEWAERHAKIAEVAAAAVE